MSPVSTSTLSCSMIPHERVVPDDHAALVAVAVEVDHHAAPLHAARGHSLDAESFGERGGFRLEDAGRAGLRRVGGPDDVLAGAKAVVVARLRHAVAVRVEHEADMRERVPVGGILGVQHRRVVADEIGRVGIVVGDAIVHPRPSVAQRRAQDRRKTARAQHVAARPVERQAQAERDPFANLAHARPHALGRQEVQAAELVVGPEVAPVRSFRSAAPSLRHG